MPTGSQDKQFAEEMQQSVDETIVKMSSSALDNAVEWISKNLTPDDVFPMNELVDWANDNVDKLDEDKLEKWATDNGYTKE